MAITLSGTTLTFNDSTTMTTAVSQAPSSYGIGSVSCFVSSYGAAIMPNSTISGGYLYKQASGGSTPAMTTGFGPPGNYVNSTTGTIYTHTNVSGTWRQIGANQSPAASYDGYQNQTTMSVTIFQRIS